MASVDFFGYNLELQPVNRIADLNTFTEKYGSEAGFGRCSWAACLNPHSYVVAKKDLIFRDSLKKADILLPDGVGVCVGIKFLSNTRISRFTGFDLFECVMSIANERFWKIAFVGSTDFVLNRLEEKVKKIYPNVEIVLTWSPPFVNEIDEDLRVNFIEQINKVKPDIVWVGLTAPKQEILISGSLDHLDARFCGAIGAVFDYLAGTVVRPNRIFRMVGLEWLPRLLMEPKRLWRRMLLSAPVFVYDVLKIKIFRRRRRVLKE